MVVVEAFAAGTPVIASRIGSLAELIEHGVTGLLVNPGNPDSLRTMLEWALDNPEKMAAMGRTARQRHEELYSKQRNYRHLMKIYQDAIRAACSPANYHLRSEG
jgi:glycosyltransferase involved in cell wall biosynthesis